MYSCVKDFLDYFFTPNVQLFCYGSNSIKQLKERLDLRDITCVPAHLENYAMIFAGKSRKWQNGGVATIIPFTGGKVLGILAEIPRHKLKILDKFEGGYYRKEIIVSGKKRVKAVVYIKINSEFKANPSREYLEAINIMLGDRETSIKKQL